MLVLEEKGLQGYGNKLVSFSKKEHKGEDVLKLNPRGQVGSPLTGLTWPRVSTENWVGDGGGGQQGGCCVSLCKVSKVHV